jgi:hypothetical protein
MQMYPGWSARDNYGLKKKRQSTGHTPPVLNNSHKKAPRENNSMVNSPGHLNHNSPHRFGQQHHLVNSPQMNSTKNPMQLENDCLNQKKCRARFGLEGQSQWCKHCRRKKKCTRFLEDDMSNHTNNNIINTYHNSSLNTHVVNGNPSSLSSPTIRSDNDDSMNEPDSDDILSRQIDSIEDDDDEEEDDDEHHTDNDDDSDEENKQQHHHHHQPVSLVYKPIPSKIDSHQQQFQPPPPAHLYQPSNIPSHFVPGFHY